MIVNKNYKRIMAFLLVISFIISAGITKPVYAKKAGKLKLSKTSVSLTVGKTAKVTAKGSFKKLKVKASKKGIVKVMVKKKKITIKGLKAGNVVLNVKAYNKKGKLVSKGKIKVISLYKVDNGTDPSDATKAYDAGEYSITKVHSGEGTFYDRTSTGAANLDDYEATYLTAAMNNEDYVNGLAGAYVEVTDFYGHVLVEKGISINTAGKAVKGKNNFPY